MRIFVNVMSLTLLITTLAAGAQQVGFQSVSIPATTKPAIPVEIWYPTSGEAHIEPLGLFHQNVALLGPVQGTGLALIVISHGNGGTMDEHYDTAIALAKAGFVVAALEHTGDNYRDQTRAADLPNRTNEIHLLIDFMLSQWKGHVAINAQRVGAFGFSSGGFTVLAAAGGNPDLTAFATHCSAHPNFYDCALLAAHPLAQPALTVTSRTASVPLTHDPRIKALVVAAPALGFTLLHGLATVTQPVQLWRADDDKVLPAPEYADAVRSALPTPPEFHPVIGAGHFDFLAPCTADLAKAAPQICTSETGFDRVAFHQTFNDAVTRFFEANLPSTPMAP